MTSRELLQQALEALETYECYPEKAQAVADAIREHLARPEPRVTIWRKENGKMIEVIPKKDTDIEGEVA